MDIISIIVQLIGGAIGGAGSGKVIKDGDMGTLINTIVGAIGGLGGGSLTAMWLGGTATAAATSSPDIASLAAQLVGGGVGGVILQAIIGLIKNKLVTR